MSKNSNLEFEVLAIDAKGEIGIDSEDNLAYAVMANAMFGDNPKYERDRKEVEYLNYKIKLQRIAIHDLVEGVRSAYLIRLRGEYSFIGYIREILLKNLKDRGFAKIYITEDGVSRQIASELYPKIYRVENELRAYLIRFLTTRLGPDWWDMNASAESREKVHKRKNNETTFSRYAESQVYFIDFPDLGKMVYEQSSGFLSRDDVVKRVTDCELTIDAFQKLKEELQSNYYKFFRSHFKENNFQNKWERLSWIRNKIAHNNLFTEADKAEGIKLSDDLLSIIEKASIEAPALTIGGDEIAQMKSTISDKQKDPDARLTYVELVNLLPSVGLPGAMTPKDFVDIFYSAGYSRETVEQALREYVSSGDIKAAKIDGIDRIYLDPENRIIPRRR